MKKILVTSSRILIITVGFFLLLGTVVLKIILATDLPNEIFIDCINSFEHIYYSIITYKINLLITFCVPFIDLYVVLKIPKSNKKIKAYLLLTLLVYTIFFVLRLTTLQA